MRPQEVVAALVVLGVLVAFLALALVAVVVMVSRGRR